MKTLSYPFPLLVAALSLSACSLLPPSESVDSGVKQLAPYGLVGTTAADTERSDDWLDSFGDPALLRLIERSVDNNFSLKEARYRVQAAEQARIAGRGALLPEVSLDASASRSRTVRPKVFSEGFDASFSLSWEADLWGRNYATFEASDLLLQAERASLQSARLSLAGEVAKSWYAVVTSRKLSGLFSKRVDNLKANLEIISSGYRRGINSALDVYLARSDLATEQSNLAAQREQTREAVRQLQLLLGDYPSGRSEDLPAGFDAADATLPQLPELNALTITTDSVRYRYDLQETYLQLAAQDRQLAAAHLARFPSLTIVASAGDSASRAGDLFDGQSLAWNIIGGLTQPIFYGGRLAAAEEQQRAVLRQTEQQYLQALNTAFSEIEQALSSDLALGEQLERLGSARRDAEAAEALAFDQYRQGLATYVEVLEAQRRAFSAQSSLLSISNQYINNRINMYLALGADYRKQPGH